MRSSLALAVALMGLAVQMRQGPQGIPGEPGDDWNDGAGGERGPEGVQGLPRPQLNRPYLKPKKGRSNAPRTKTRPKKNSR